MVSRGSNKTGMFTPPKLNIEPENEGLEDDFPFQRGDFQVPAVSFQGCLKTIGTVGKKTS